MNSVTISYRAYSLNFSKGVIDMPKCHTLREAIDHLVFSLESSIPDDYVCYHVCDKYGHLCIWIKPTGPSSEVTCARFYDIDTVYTDSETGEEIKL